SRKVLTATCGLAAVSYLGTTGCSGQVEDGNQPDGSAAASSDGTSGTGAFSSGNLMPYPTGGGGGTLATGGTTNGGETSTGGSFPGTGSFSSGNLMPYPYPTGGTGGECMTGAAGEG